MRLLLLVSVRALARLLITLCPGSFLAGAAYDPCYHAACDTVDNVNLDVLTDLSRCAAYLVERMATQDLAVILPPVGAGRADRRTPLVQSSEGPVRVRDGVLYGSRFHDQR